MRFSIILPTFNRGSTYLKYAVESVIKQEFKDWELIIIDNNSTDNTIDLVESYNCEKITIHNISNDGIIAKSRNLGIENASGDFIAFLDSDDYWYPNKLKVCNDILVNNNVNLVCHGEKWEVDVNKSVMKKYGPKERFIFENMYNSGTSAVSSSAIVINKDLILKVGMFNISPEIITSEDYDLWLKISNIDHDIYFTEEILGVFRIHESSESSDVQKNSLSTELVLRNHYDQHPHNNKLNRDLALANLWSTSAKTLQIRGLYLESLKFYIKSLKKRFSIKVLFFIFTLFIPHKVLKFLYYDYRY